MYAEVKIEKFVKVSTHCLIKIVFKVSRVKSSQVEFLPSRLKSSQVEFRAKSTYFDNFRVYFAEVKPEIPDFSLNCAKIMSGNIEHPFHVYLLVYGQCITIS